MAAMRLTAYLEANNITDAEFARRVKVSHSLVHRWKSGAKRPSLETMWRIESETGGQVTLDDFKPTAPKTPDAIESAA